MTPARGAFAPHVGGGESGRHAAKDDVLWQFWFDFPGTAYLIWERSCDEAVAKITRCLGRPPVRIFPYKDFGTGSDVAGAARYNEAQIP